MLRHLLFIQLSLLHFLQLMLADSLPMNILRNRKIYKLLMFISVKRGCALEIDLAIWLLIQIILVRSILKIGIHLVLKVTIVDRLLQVGMPSSCHLMVHPVGLLVVRVAIIRL